MVGTESKMITEVLDLSMAYIQNEPGTKVETFCDEVAFER